jgi:hypothetical protein
MIELDAGNELVRLLSLGWKTRRAGVASTIPPGILERYAWLTPDILSLIEVMQGSVNREETAWFLCSSDFAGTSESAFAWNEWERMSLDACDGDQALRSDVLKFWDNHFPIMQSVKSGYAFFGLRSSDLAVVVGEEPEFECVTMVAATFLDFVGTVNTKPYERWI